MRILVLTDEIFPDGVSGLGKTVYNECVGLTRRGHQITVLVRSIDGSLPSETLLNGFRLVRFFGPERGQNTYRIYPLTILSKVTKWLRQQRDTYDVIYIYNPLYILPVLFARKRSSTSTVFRFTASISAEIHIAAQRGKYGRLRLPAHAAASVLGIVERWALRRTDAILPASEFTAQIVRQLGCADRIPRNDPIIPLGVDIHSYLPASRSQARMHLELPETRPILITVRRLDGRMGLPNLISAISLLQKKHPEILQIIVGKGYMRASLETLIDQYELSENIRLEGFVSEAELPYYLAAADLFVLPTEALEGFGLATIEALAVGLPVVGTPIGATPEILSRIDPTLLTRDASAASLAMTLQYWLDNAHRLAELSERCRAEVEAQYDIDKVAQRLEASFAAVR